MLLKNHCICFVYPEQGLAITDHTVIYCHGYNPIYTNYIIFLIMQYIYPFSAKFVGKISDTISKINPYQPQLDGWDQK